MLQEFLTLIMLFIATPSSYCDWRKIWLPQLNEKKSKPFENLTKHQLEEELVSRGEHYLENKKKPELSEMLTNTLKGCQHVPAFYTNNPQQNQEI